MDVNLGVYNGPEVMNGLTRVDAEWVACLAFTDRTALSRCGEEKESKSYIKDVTQNNNLKLIF